MLNLKLPAMFALLIGLGLSACTNPDGSTYNGGTGALAGAGVGAILGQAIGGNGRSAVVGGIIGATIGGLAGDSADQQQNGY